MIPTAKFHFLQAVVIILAIMLANVMVIAMV